MQKNQVNTSSFKNSELEMADLGVIKKGVRL